MPPPERVAATSGCRSTGSTPRASRSGSASSSTAGASRPAPGTLVAVEGGPGGATTDSRGYFLELARPLRPRPPARRRPRHRALRCARLPGAAPHDRRLRAPRRPLRRAARPARRPLHARAPSVDDLADVLDALGIAVVDFYGDSYGSYFGQAFAVNHPQRLRSLVLDGTYPLPGHRPGARRPRRGDLARAAARLRAPAELRRPRRGPAGGAAPARRADPRGPRARHRHQRRGRAHPRAARHRGARRAAPVGLREPADVPRPARRPPAPSSAATGRRCCG